MNSSSSPFLACLSRSTALALGLATGLAGLLAGCAQTAESAGPSLYQRRLQIVDTPKQQAATAPAPAAAPAGSGAASGVAPGAASAGAPAANAASSPGFLQGIIEKLGPPSGRSMNEATQLKAPDFGITVPSEKARAAAAAASAASR